MITVRPQYDSNGFDSGLWVVEDPDEFLYYANISLRMEGMNRLVVGQFQDWDNESYDDDGCIDSECTALGELNCGNPYQDELAAACLYGWLQASKAVAEI